jgi:hypothetical protein
MRSEIVNEQGRHTHVWFTSVRLPILSVGGVEQQAPCTGFVGGVDLSWSRNILRNPRHQSFLGNKTHVLLLLVIIIIIIIVVVVIVIVIVIFAVGVGDSSLLAQDFGIERTQLNFAAVAERGCEHEIGVPWHSFGMHDAFLHNPLELQLGRL